MHTAVPAGTQCVELWPNLSSSDEYARIDWLFCSYRKTCHAYLLLKPLTASEYMKMQAQQVCKALCKEPRTTWVTGWLFYC